MTRKWSLNRKKWEKVCKIGQDSKGQIVELNYNNSNKSDTGGKKNGNEYLWSTVLLGSR